MVIHELSWRDDDFYKVSEGAGIASIGAKRASKGAGSAFDGNQRRRQVPLPLRIEGKGDGEKVKEYPWPRLWSSSPRGPLPKTDAAPQRSRPSPYGGPLTPTKWRIPTFQHDWPFPCPMASSILRPEWPSLSPMASSNPPPRDSALEA